MSIRDSACVHQGFSLNDRVFGFQFHLETTPESAKALIKYYAEDISHGNFVQNDIEILADDQKFTQINQVMQQILMKILTHHFTQ